MSARIAALEAATPPRGREHRRWRTSGAVVLIVIASLLSLLSVLAVWTSDFVGDTDRYVRTVAPLASQPDVQTAVTNRVTQVVLEQIDVNALVKELSDAAAQQGVPQNAANLINDLSGPIKSGLTQLVGSVVNKVVTSSAFETVWVEANRAVHSSLDKALTGQGGGAIKLENNQVAIDLAPVIAKVKDELVNAGLGVAAKIPDVHTNFVVFASDDIGKVKSYLRLLDIMGAWLPVVTVLIAAGGVFLAVNRRRALVGAAVGVALAMLLLGIALTVFRAFYLDHLPPGADQAAAGTVYDTLIRFMRATVRAVGTVAVVTAVGAALIGPSRPAVAVRTGCRRIIGSLRGALYSLGMRLGPVGPFVHRFKRWIGALILLVAAVILATWSYPTWAVVLWITFFVALAFAIREFLDTGGDGDRAPTPTTTGGPPPANA
ncbi:hypothetical protein ACIG0C_24370 [Kitasatospora aureofaciens]|uniref:hypothetical protein n=1 Tax=Kitasatospora aureofaciens TaxID=1894 RepID=UPI001E2E3514|nr:hypothetical protein [Kitasatospora aureofaciens]UKZ03228.1 hypothetical protein BOQ63_003735 [Streptomyces viridifaciens]